MGLGEDRGHQGSSRGLAVGTGDGDTVLKSHQLSQHLGSRNDRDHQFAGTDDFRVGIFHSRGNNDHIYLSSYLLGSMAIGNTSTEGSQSPRGLRLAHVRATDLIAEIE